MSIKDGDWELMKWDAQTGASTWGMRNEYGQLVVRTDYPVEATISENAAVRNIADKAWKGDYHRIASVPLNVYWDKLQEATTQGDDAYLSRWLNDSDNRAWRNKEGNV